MSHKTNQSDKMLRLRRNKKELLVLTGAIYSFVAYLTAFTLEVLFLIDYARQKQATEQALANVRISQTNPIGTSDAHPLHGTQNLSSFDSRLNFELMHAHILVSCLAVAVLYFLVFITSLILIVALILRSTFTLLTWMCAMTTMFLPEFGLVAYVSFYSWGIKTRNGQTEIIFYLIRAALNPIFIFRAHKLFKQWNYEKNFFRLKSGFGQNPAVFSSSGFGSGAASTGSFAAYDSPYFVGDSSSTTINPVFSSSTLNLNRYDHMRDAQSRDSPTNNSTSGSVFSSSDYVSDYNNTSRASQHQRISSPATSANTMGKHRSRHQVTVSQSQGGQGFRDNGIVSSGRVQTRTRQRERPPATHDLDHLATSGSSNKRLVHQPTNRFFLGGTELFSNLGRLSSKSANKNEPLVAQSYGNRAAAHYASQLSINDGFPDYEMDIDYRTLEHGHSHYLDKHSPVDDPRRSNRHQDSMYAPGSEDMVYSTQSLDRRHLKEYGMSNEQVILRPIGHQPFDYLHRPGSTTNLDKINGIPAKNKRDAR